MDTSPENSRVMSSSTAQRGRSPMRRRPKGGMMVWIMLALVGSGGCARGVAGEDNYHDYGYEQPHHHQPMQHAGGGGESGGLIAPVAVGLTGFFATKWIFSGRRKRRSIAAMHQEEHHLQQKYVEDITQINQKFGQMERSLSASLDEKTAQARQLEQFLYSLPDTNEDGLITRYEFDKYMNDYKRSHPGLTDRDLPKFEEMDHNSNGHINFQEWEEYQLMAMNNL